MSGYSFTPTGTGTARVWNQIKSIWHLSLTKVFGPLSTRSKSSIWFQNSGSVILLPIFICILFYFFLIWKIRLNTAVTKKTEKNSAWNCCTDPVWCRHISTKVFQSYKLGIKAFLFLLFRSEYHPPLCLFIFLLRSRLWTFLKTGAIGSLCNDSMFSFLSSELHD